MQRLYERELPVPEIIWGKAKIPGRPTFGLNDYEIILICSTDGSVLLQILQSGLHLDWPLVPKDIASSVFQTYGGCWPDLGQKILATWEAIFYSFSGFFIWMEAQWPQITNIDC